MFSNNPSIINDESSERGNKRILNHRYREEMRNPNKNDKADW